MSPVNSVPYTVSLITGIAFHLCKTGFNCSVVIIAVLISLLPEGGLLGVREVTVIAAVFVGMIIKPIANLMLARLKAFLK